MDSNYMWFVVAFGLLVAERFVDSFGELARTNNTLIVPANLADCRA